MNLYVTADVVGKADHGGGQVTARESAALSTLGECDVIDRKYLQEHVIAHLNQGEGEPWAWDRAAFFARDWFVDPPKLAHFYAGTFSRTIKQLKRNGTKVAYTAAAHSIQESKDEHERLGAPFDYPHLTEPSLWERYVGGYRAADVVVCPSGVSAAAMRSYGCKDVAVIPHGVSLRARVAGFPPRFVVGYLGSCGAPDKGLIYLLQAWKRMGHDFRDAVLRIGGVDSLSDWVRHLVVAYGGGNIELLGWVPNVDDFYDSLSVYVQPSVTEGFGIEVLEACAAGRPVIASDGAGASELLPNDCRFRARNVEELMIALDLWRRRVDRGGDFSSFRCVAEQHAWDRIAERYVALWRGLVS